MKVPDGQKLRILTLVNFYYPGHRGGGAIRSTFNLTERLGQYFDFYVVTADRDFLDDSAYPDIHSNRWQKVRSANVFYAPVGDLSLKRLRTLILDVNPSIIYLNSFFHRVFVIRILLLQRLRLIAKVPVVLAPRGELAAGALAIKAGRKRWFRAFAAACGLYRNVIWQASSQEEATDIRQNFHPGLATKCRVIVAPDLIDGSEVLGAEPPHRTKAKDQLKIAFVSRISPKKNLLTAIQILRAVRANIQFDIYGPIDDPEYWQDCNRELSDLPKNISTAYFGDVPNSRVASVLAQYDLFFLPTLGENFGHAIVEALLAGLPVLISDRTPWRQLEQLCAGWDISLDDHEHFVRVIESCCEMDSYVFRRFRDGARRYGLSIREDKQALAKNIDLFEQVAGAKHQLQAVAAVGISELPMATK